MSDTRWACRYLALDAVANTFHSLLATLEVIADGVDKPKAIEAIGILVQVNSFKFLAHLIMFTRILSITKSLSDSLQNEKIDMALAVDLVVSTCDTLKEFRNDAKWEHMHKYIVDIASLHNIDVSLLEKHH